MNAISPLGVLALKNMDRSRQARGRALDQAGYGPHETPFTVLHTEPGLVLRKYGQDTPGAPAVLLVPAPIKKAYIWDLAPEVSVVRRWLEQGFRVYLAEWVPGTGPAFGLADYADRLLGVCRRAIKADSGNDALTVAGHSLGGILAAIFSCVHADAVRSLVLLEAPLHFGPDVGCFANLVSCTPHAGKIAEAFSEVPGAFLNVVSAMAAPHAFALERMLDRYLCMGNPHALKMHMRVERWTHDEFPLPGRLFTEVIELLWREDRFMRGTLRIGDRTIGPQDLHASLVSVMDPRSHVIPPQSVVPFHDAASSQDKCLLRYEGDVGVALQHVGVLVGASAHARLWPAIFDWLGTAS